MKNHPHRIWNHLLVPPPCRNPAIQTLGSTNLALSSRSTRRED